MKWPDPAFKKNAEGVAREAIAYVRKHYDESIFPTCPPGRHSEVYDGEAAAVARLTCDNILREFNERLAESVSEHAVGRCTCPLCPDPTHGRGVT